MTDKSPPMTPAEMRLEDGHPMVLAYRMGRVESQLGHIEGKLDLIAQNYPTTATIQLLLEPLKEKVEALETKNKEEESNRTAGAAQLKMAVIAAVVSPVITFVVTLILLGRQ